MSTTFAAVREQLLAARRRRGLSQAELASRVGRTQNRISEFERDLGLQRLGRDRLTLLADICDALGIVPVLVPRADVGRVRALIGEGSEPPRQGPAGTAFDDVFVDLGDEEP